MKINKRITLTIDEADVKEIIREYLKTQGYRIDTDDIQLNIGCRTEGYGYEEHDVFYFKECRVEVKED